MFRFSKKGRTKFSSEGKETSQISTENSFPKRKEMFSSIEEAAATKDAPRSNATVILSATEPEKVLQSKVSQINQETIIVPEGTYPFVPEVVNDQKLVNDEMLNSKIESVFNINRLYQKLDNGEIVLNNLKEAVFNLEDEFLNLKQQSNENVSNYTMRVSSVTMEYIEKWIELRMSLNDMGVRKFTMENMEKWVQMKLYEAKIIFEQGLKDQLKALIKIRSYETLGQSSAAAEKIEETLLADNNIENHNDQVLISDQSGQSAIEENSQQQQRFVKSKICRNCGNEGHTAKNCTIFNHLCLKQ